MEEINIRKVFLRSFVKELISNSYVQEAEPEKNLKQQKESAQKPLKMREKKEMLRLPAPKIRPFPEQSFNKTTSLFQSPSIKHEPINLGKVTQYLLDPSVLSVESQGPDKNLLVNRSGVIQATPTSLTREEIEALIQEISDKTRIPVIPGLFKAAFQDLIISAVVSEFIGTRFLIQKMNPLTQI